MLLFPQNVSTFPQNMNLFLNCKVQIRLKKKKKVANVDIKLSFTNNKLIFNNQILNQTSGPPCDCESLFVSLASLERIYIILRKECIEEENIIFCATAFVFDNKILSK